MAFQFHMRLRVSAQENRAKGGHSRKPNLPSFSVSREVLRTLQTSWVYFPKYGRFLQLFEILDFARLKPEINRLTRQNRPAQKSASRNQTCRSMGNPTLYSYKMDI